MNRRSELAAGVLDVLRSTSSKPLLCGAQRASPAKSTGPKSRSAFLTPNTRHGRDLFHPHRDLAFVDVVRGFELQTSRRLAHPHRVDRRYRLESRAVHKHELDMAGKAGAAEAPPVADAVPISQLVMDRIIPDASREGVNTSQAWTSEPAVRSQFSRAGSLERRLVKQSGSSLIARFSSLGLSAPPATRESALANPDR